MGVVFRKLTDHRRARSLTLAALFVTLLARPAFAGPPAPRRCEHGIPQAATQWFFAELNKAPLGECALVSVDTQRTSMLVTFSTKAPPAVIKPARCAGRTGNGYVAEIPRELEAACPDAARHLRNLTQAPPTTAAPKLGGEGAGWVRIVAAVSLVASLVLAFAAVARGLRKRTLSAKAWLVGGALFACASLVRVLVEPSLANWYAEVVSPAGQLPSARFGPGALLVQQVLRWLLPWSDTTLFTATALIGAASIPLLVALLREKQVPWPGAAAAGLFLALTPLHVRISASASDHVLASTLTLLAWFAWLRASNRKDYLLGALALVLLPAVALTRVDAWPALLALPVWQLLRDREEGPARRWWSAAFLAVWVVTGAVAYWGVVLPSHHPGPSLADRLDSLRYLVSQWWTLSFGSPAWLPPVALVLALIGLLALARRRRALLACVLAAPLLAFLPLGRHMVCGLMCARYFLPAVAVFAGAAGIGFAALLDLWQSRRKAPLPWPVHAAAWTGLAVLLAVRSWDPLRARYSFQDEYTFLRRALPALPPDCHVVQLGLRQPGFGTDIDCCLDTPRSPLELAFPRLQFDNVTPETLPDSGCLAWYEGAACSIDPGDQVPERLHPMRATLQAQCRDMRDAARWRPVSEAEVSSLEMQPIFGPHRPTVRLWLREE